MRVGFIGAGKVATAFGRYLDNHGMAIAGYFDRHPEKTAHACRMTRGRACASGAEVAACSDVVLITTRDDQIQTVVRQLCRQKALDAHHLVGHMSGAHPSSILAPAAESGAAIFSLHPLQAFAQEDKAVTDLSRTWFSLDGTDARIDALARMLDQTGNRYFRILPEHKRLYHLSACIFSNYLVTLLQAGLTALEQSGIPPGDGLTAMLPLIQGTIANAVQMGPARALTGPIARGDALTIQHHLEALEERQLTDLKAFYSYLGLKTLELARQGVLQDSLRAEALQQLFSSQAAVADDSPNDSPGDSRSISIDE
jgi:predicted short-subunit dehydrogenase-like oxidoreductase (DUF2520 family)